MSKNKDHPMRKISIEKIVLNIGCAGDMDKIERAKKLLEILTGKKPVVTKSKRRSTFGIAKGKPVGVKVTLRGKDAEEFFKKVLEAKEYTLKASQIDNEGNIGIGISEYIELPGIKYMHDIGMLGMDVIIKLKRPGFRIKYRRIQKRKLPKNHRISREDTIEWLQKQGVKVI